jgi:hypothetical protein
VQREVIEIRTGDNPPPSEVNRLGQLYSLFEMLQTIGFFAKDWTMEAHENVIKLKGPKTKDGGRIINLL